MNTIFPEKNFLKIIKHFFLTLVSEYKLAVKFNILFDSGSNDKHLIMAI